MIIILIDIILIVVLSNFNNIEVLLTDILNIQKQFETELNPPENFF